MNITRNLLLVLTLSTPVLAQIDRETDALVDYVHLRHAPLSEVQSWSALGYRMSNFEISSFTPFELNVSMVRNTGVYAAGWLFYFDKTGNELETLCANSNARIVDLARYEVGGVPTFAALLFVNSGQQQKSWHWHQGIPQGSVYSTVNAMGHRVIDLEPYMWNGNWYYHAITIANTGPDQKPWWVYTNTDVAGVQGYMAQHNARLYDFKWKTFYPYSCACVLVQDDVRSLTLWGEFYGSGFHVDTDRGGRVSGLFDENIGSHVITLIDDFDAYFGWGAGCPGTHGTSVHTATGSGLTGTEITYRTNHLWPWTIGVLCYGGSPTNIPLAAIGAPGCTGYTLPFATTTHYANASGVATASLAVPVNPSLEGVMLMTQWIALDPPLNALGMQTSNALVTTLRHW